MISLIKPGRYDKNPEWGVNALVRIGGTHDTYSTTNHDRPQTNPNGWRSDEFHLARTANNHTDHYVISQTVGVSSSTERRKFSEIVLVTMDQTELQKRSDGTFKKAYSDMQFIEAIRAIDELAYSVPIAEQVGCHPDLVRKRLPSLEDNGKVESQSVGDATVWHVSE